MKGDDGTSYNPFFIFAQLQFCQYYDYILLRILSTQLNFIMIKPQSSFVQDTNNYTTHKNLQSKNRFNVQMLNAELHEPQEKIASQAQLLNIKYRPQAESGISPRRSMIRQNQIWSDSMHDTNLNSISARKIGDDYYNEQVAAKTIIFLTRMHELLQFQEQTVHQKRRQIIDIIVDGIRSEWQSVKNELINIIVSWSQDCEERQISYFLEHAESKVSGELVEINSKINLKRDEMELYLNKIKQIQVEQRIIAKEEIVERSFIIKQVLKQIWARDYQFQVNEISREVSRIVNTISTKSYTYPHANLELSKLHLKIDRLLQSQFKFEKPSQPHDIHSSQKTVMKSLLYIKKNQLEVLRAERQAQWEILCRQTLNQPS